VGVLATFTSLDWFVPFATVEGKTYEGISSPLYPAFTDEEPISKTRIDSSDISDQQSLVKE